MTILDKIVESTKIRIDKSKTLNLYRGLPCFPKKNFEFEEAFKTPELSFICEVKRASPSKGLIVSHFPYKEIAREYEDAGAAAISVLTEPDFFRGNDSYLRDISRTVCVPTLRKDFIIDEYQIYEAFVLGAFAVLLIAAILDTKQLSTFIKAADNYGLSSLVETRNEAEIKSALEAGARIIGVNNRDLNTFEVDVKTTAKLRKFVPKNIIYVAESGIATREDILKLGDVDAVLIGETIMKCTDKKAKLEELRGEQ